MSPTLTMAARWALTAYLGFATVYAALQLARGMEPGLSWLGLLLAAGGPLAGLWLHRDPGQRPALGYMVVSGLGVAIAMTLSWRFGPAAGWVHLWAGLALVGWFAWVRWLRTA